MALSLPPSIPAPVLEEPIQLSNELNSDKCPIQLIKDDRLYCMQSTFVFFQVKRHLFCVPTYRFVDESHVFTKLFKLPEPNVCGAKGSSREDPIIIPDISPKDFHYFLKALYPLTVSVHLELSKAEWISVLRLSTLWYFLKYRQMAISYFEDLPGFNAIELVDYGRQFKISTWINTGYTMIVSRDRTISKLAASKLGFDTTSELFRLRERRIQGTLASDLSAIIRFALKDQFDLVERSELEYRTDKDQAPTEEDSELGCEISLEATVTPASVQFFSEAGREKTEKESEGVDG